VNAYSVANDPTVIRTTLRERARAELIRATYSASSDGIPGTDGPGHLIRPIVAMAGLADLDDPPSGFWDAVLAVQLAHEASLIHDDVVDAATERRGEPTLAISGGVAKALLRGDHLLTAAYRAAARTKNLDFVTIFARAVERTVAWEGMQGKATGRILDMAEYERIALGKSGELLGCALVAGPVIEGRTDAERVFEVGRRIGLLYQMLDDLLDYCPATDTGKPALGDFGQRRWTWVCGELPHFSFDTSVEEIVADLHRPVDGRSPMSRAVDRLAERGAQVAAEIRIVYPNDKVLRSMISEWVELGRAAAARQALDGVGDRRNEPEADGRVDGRDSSISGSPPSLYASGVEAHLIPVGLLSRVPDLTDVDRYLAVNSRSFRFASRFFSRTEAARVARVYAYCRVTDDLVDRPVSGTRAEELLDTWIGLSRRAYDGHPTGLPLLDSVMAEMSGAGIPFDYADELAEGMRMDLRGDRYASLPELRRYTYRVASVVGLWLTRLFGVDEPGLLMRAERMGHAMQMTNILRDVGEDWGRGRLYLPADMLASHGIEAADLDRMCSGGPVAPAYTRLMEELMRVAEADYDAGLEVLPMLPASFGRPVAVAAHVYRGIHAEIRRRGYDNLRSRAYTRPVGKGVLALRGLWELRRGGGRASSLEIAAPIALPRSGGG